MTDITIYFYSCGENRDNWTHHTQRVRTSFNTVLLRDPLNADSLNLILSNHCNGFVVACNASIILPDDIGEKILQVIINADDEYGKNQWAMIGNTGIDFFSCKKIQYESNNNTTPIPSRSAFPRPAVAITDDLLLLNMSALAARGVSISEETKYSGSSISSLLKDCYKNDLVCLIDSHLYAFNTRTSEMLKIEDQLNIESAHSEDNVKFAGFVDRKLISSHALQKIYGGVYTLAFNTLRKMYNGRTKKTVSIIIRTTLQRKEFLRRLLNSIKDGLQLSGSKINVKIVLVINNFDESTLCNEKNEIADNFKELNITAIVVTQKGGQHSSRVEALRIGVQSVQDDNAFIWFIDDDDFVNPDIFAFLPIILHANHIIIGNSLAYVEENPLDHRHYFQNNSRIEKSYYAEDFAKNFLGNNYIPLCSVIYPSNIIKRIFDEYSLQGEYYEDYALLLLASRGAEILLVMNLMSGVSFHGQNTIFEKTRYTWNVSFATFVSEIINKSSGEEEMYQLSKMYKSLLSQLQATTDHLELKSLLFQATVEQLHGAEELLRRNTAELIDLKNTNVWRLIEKMRQIFINVFPEKSRRRIVCSYFKKYITPIKKKSRLVGKQSLCSMPDEEWFRLNVQRAEYGISDQMQLPGFPSKQFQINTCGSFGKQTLEEAYNFFCLVKNYARMLGRDLSLPRKVLDFGCGWGRITRFFLKDIESSNLYGIDCTPLMIELCKKLFKEGNFSVCTPTPPTEFSDECMDIVFSYSVFSHLSESVGLQWIQEFTRILKPGGILIATTYGRDFIEFCKSLQGSKHEFAWHNSLAQSFTDAEKTLRDYDDGKFLFSPTGGGYALLPTFYGEALFSKKYVEREWGKYLYFKEFFYDPTRLPQAVIIMQKENKK